MNAITNKDAILIAASGHDVASSNNITYLLHQQIYRDLIHHQDHPHMAGTS